MSDRLLWIPRLAIVGVFGATLYAKFSGQPDAVALFTELGVEPWGRLALGTFEALLVIGILLPSTYPIAAALTVGVLGGALFSHFTILGIEVAGDGGTLFGMAVVGFLSGLIVAWARRRALPVVGGLFR